MSDWAINAVDFARATSRAASYAARPGNILHYQQAWFGDGMVSAFSGQSGAVVPVPVVSDSPFAVNAGDLAGIAKSIADTADPNDAVGLTLTEKSLRIQVPGYKCSLALFAEADSASEIMNIIQRRMPDGLSALPIEVLRAANRASFCCGRDDVRVVLSAVHVDRDCVMTTDSVRITRIGVPEHDHPSFLLSSDLIKSFESDLDSVAQWSVDRSFSWFLFKDDSIVYGSLINGEFPASGVDSILRGLRGEEQVVSVAVPSVAAISPLLSRMSLSTVAPLYKVGVEVGPEEVKMDSVDPGAPAGNQVLPLRGTGRASLVTNLKWFREAVSAAGDGATWRIRAGKPMYFRSSDGVMEHVLNTVGAARIES